MNKTDGFSLVEVLVALAVLSIAAVALIKVQGESASAASAARERLLAQIVAENQLVETVASPDPATPGVTTGEVAMGGGRWTWTQDVAETGDRAVSRIDVVVRAVGDDAILAALAGFKARTR